MKVVATNPFNEPVKFKSEEVLHKLKHFLPAQAPLKDFIHHNTLHAFQHSNFYDGLRDASEILGYRVSLSLEEYRALYKNDRIRDEIINRVIIESKGEQHLNVWKEKMLHKHYVNDTLPRIGKLRANWKKQYHIDLDSMVHPSLFRILCSYLDQGISIWNFPVWHHGFLPSIKEMERNSFTSFFKTKRAKNLLMKGDCSIDNLLKLLVGEEALFEQYLFDQQFAHQGWSGMVSAVEDQPQTLLDNRKITLEDAIVFELLLEIDALDFQFGEIWSPLHLKLKHLPTPLFSEVKSTELFEVTVLWQEAFEWSYYDEVLAGIHLSSPKEGKEVKHKSFQALFCIDDRECSLRRYIEKSDAHCETFGTPGFFGVEFYFKPEHAKFLTKLCPAPVNPKFLIKEVDSNVKQEKELHFNKNSHGLVRGLLSSQSVGYWSVFKLLLNVFRPTASPAAASSFRHMAPFSKLTIENKNAEEVEDDLQIGFNTEEMANRVEGLLKSIGLVKNFAPIVYVVGHGSSSVNNPHYAAYDCGACSGRAGSVNARVICFMANHKVVRALLAERGLIIPETTQFVGGLHDTTRDEIIFFDEKLLNEVNAKAHQLNLEVMYKALDLNAKERSRRFESINTALTPQQIHNKVRTRSVSLFEPRPELNHATNALCIVGRRALSKGLFLDRRSFMNSFDYEVDHEGKYLLNILKAAAPVCGGINLEYYFSRVDNQKLGAGTKLPHNVMGLFGVANGIDGDLRPGLPSQMIEVHDPVRLLIMVEHFPDVVLSTIQKNAETYEWFINEWVHLVAIHPETKAFYSFKKGAFVPYYPLMKHIETVSDLNPLLASNQENFPVYLIS